MLMCLQRYKSRVHINVHFIRSKRRLYLFQPASHPVEFESVAIFRTQRRATSIHSNFKAASPIAHCMQLFERQFAYLGPHPLLLSMPRRTHCQQRMIGYPRATCIGEIHKLPLCNMPLGLPVWLSRQPCKHLVSAKPTV